VLLKTEDMSSVWFLVVIFNLVVYLEANSDTGVNCDKLGVEFYENLGCDVVRRSEDGCPAEYDCETLINVEYGDRCYYRGKLYRHGEDIADGEPACQKKCRCRVINVNNTVTPIITCSEIGCRNYQPLTEQEMNAGCFYLYEHGNCCPIGKKCRKLPEIEKCEVNGVEYREETTIKQNQTCKHCVCKKGFLGKLEEPFCKSGMCGYNLQMHHQEPVQKLCAPLYLTEFTEKISGDLLCCPISFVCRDGHEKIEKSASKVEGKADVGKCRYGDTTLDIGDYFLKNIGLFFNQLTVDVKCECLIPPLLTCTQQGKTSFKIHPANS